jgi:hypothetical protein
VLGHVGLTQKVLSLQVDTSRPFCMLLVQYAIVDEHFFEQRLGLGNHMVFSMAEVSAKVRSRSS